jgi:hypothetical protein
MKRTHVPALRTLVIAIAAAGCAMLAGHATATLYKWTDANGRVVYSDQPPTGNVKVEVVTGAAPPSNPNALKELWTKEAEFKKRQAEAAEKEKKTDAMRADLAKRAEQCQRVQLQIKQLSAEQVALVRYNEKGEMVVVDDTMRKKERTDLEQWIAANCKPDSAASR